MPLPRPLGFLETPHGGRVHYSVSGSGPPLLLLHGIPTSGELWDSVRQDLSKDFTTVCPDLPGFGLSTPVAGKGFVLLDAIVQMLEELESALSLRFAKLVGTDSGGVVAVQMALQKPSKVEEMVLMSTPLWADVRIPPPMRVLRTPILGELAAPLLKPLIFRHLGLDQSLRHHYTERHREAFSKPFRGILGGVRLARRVRWGRPAEVLGPISKRLGEIRARTLIINCSGDTAVPLEMAERTAEAIPGAQFLRLEGPHFIALTHPQRLVGALREFLG